MPITLKGFGGEVPRMEPRYLGNTSATVARNVHLDRGHVSALHGTKLWETLPGPRSSFYLHGAEWLSWAAANVSVVPGPVAQDRLYITTPGAAPQIRVDGAVYPLALPRPGGKPTLTRSGTLDTDLQEQVLYARTWVTQFDEESPPSNLSNPIMWSPGCTITLGGLGSPPTNRSINRQRIYRSQTSISGVTELFFVAEIPSTDTGYVHVETTAPLQEAITTQDFDQPPNGMRGLIALPNGIMAAFLGKELLFSEPYRPHAWPTKYRLTVNDPIVGLSAFGNSVAIMTTGTPYVAQGLHPEAMSLERMEVPYPCVSGAGIADLGYAAIYPSTEGLVQVSTSGAKLISSELWTREQWAAMSPATMIGAAWSGKYVFVAQGPSGRRMGIVDLSGAEQGVSWADLDAHAMVTAIGSGRLFLLAGNRMTISEFDASDQPRMQATWRSRPFVLPRPAGFAAIMVEASDIMPGDAVRVYADGALKATITKFNSIERLPAGKHRVWEAELVGRATVTSISIGETTAEVAT